MNVLITGAGSYIGCHIEEWLNKNGHNASCVDMLTDEWKKVDFSKYGAVIHVAGIVHRKDITDWGIYEKVNVELPFEVACKAKSEGVPQFVFLSSMSVYGVDKKLPDSPLIDEDTPLCPVTLYGKSKALAEEKLSSLADGNFILSIVRPPNVYGKDCRGGYINNFVSITKKVPVVPKAFENAKQSMLYIDNLSELCRLIVESKKGGVFLPQDDVSVSAVYMIKTIGNALGKKVVFSRLLGASIRLFQRISIVRKIYGGLEYSHDVSSCFDNKYVVTPFCKAMEYTVT